jgi:hypothetical protein
MPRPSEGASACYPTDQRQDTTNPADDAVPKHSLCEGLYGAGCGSIRAELSPGEVLYIPPFWWHRITSKGKLSVAVSTVNPSEEELLYADAFWQRLPFGNPAVTGSLESRLVAFKLLTTRLLQLLRCIQSPELFARDLATRYKKDLGDEGVTNVENGKVDQASNLQLTDGCLNGRWRPSADAKWEEMDIYDAEVALGENKELLEQFEESALRVARIFNSPLDTNLAHTLSSSPNYLSPAVREILVGDYIEELANWVVGGGKSGTQKAGTFEAGEILSNCFIGAENWQSDSLDKVAMALLPKVCEHVYLTRPAGQFFAGFEFIFFEYYFVSYSQVHKYDDEEQKQNALLYHYMHLIMEKNILPSSAEYQQFLEELWVTSSEDAAAKLEQLDKLGQ